MYDRHLDAFLQVADSGSFLKASERMYISANALTKQVNLLERSLGVKLFHRSTQGLVLTDAGRLVYAEAKKLIRHSHTVLQKARALEQKQEYVIHVGVSLMNPAGILLEQWSKASAQYPNIRLEVVPFEDSVPAFKEVLEQLGRKIDLISCPYQTDYWGECYRSFHLKDLPTCIACSKNHRLAGKGKLTLRELHGETLILTQRGRDSAVDPIWDALEQDHPEVHLQGIDYYDLELFNHIVSSHDLLLSAPCWSGVHPLLETIPVDWAYTTPYGLIYAKDPPGEVLQFIMAIGGTDTE